MKSMRERFDEEFYSNPDTNGDLVIQWKIGDAENTKNTLMDFIEQEIKKEREDIVEIAETHRVHGDNSRNWEYVNACEDIINTIKNRV